MEYAVDDKNKKNTKKTIQFVNSNNIEKDMEVEKVNLEVTEMEYVVDTKDKNYIKKTLNVRQVNSIDEVRKENMLKKLIKSLVKDVKSYPIKPVDKEEKSLKQIEQIKVSSSSEMEMRFSCSGCNYD
jgi:hypothetical protein